MVPRQNPQAEGMLDQQILGGSILGQPAYHKVLRRKNSLTLVIEGGWLKGMKEGSLVELFPPGTRVRKNKEPLACGVIIASTGTTGTLKLDQSLVK